MIRHKLLLLAALLFGWAYAHAQILPPPLIPDTTPRYQAQKTTTEATVQTITVQQVASGEGGHSVAFEFAWLVCSAGGSFTISQGGTPATTTALTIASLNQSPVSTVNAFYSSNVGTGAYVSQSYPLAAAVAFPVDLSRFYLTQNGGTSQNFSIIMACSSGTIEVTIQWIEKP